MVWTGWLNETRLAARSLTAYATDWASPTLRLGVTGLSRSGKTVFITALVHGLLTAARWPVFEAQAQGRIARVRLEPQSDDGIPRFPYEDHLATLTGPRDWPEPAAARPVLFRMVTPQHRGGAPAAAGGPVG
ncbi:MAG: hypothetical protein FD152_3377 [Xanthobacteraceae bacterium]|nr:MAG: hypothetical protein FD152_3377 [Xanthobacteraceae bacterium]